jgi:hypothetical protein
VYGKRGDVGWVDHAADRQSAAQVLSTRVYLIAEKRRRQWCIDRAGRDEVDTNGRSSNARFFVMDGNAEP